MGVAVTLRRRTAPFVRSDVVLGQLGRFFSPLPGSLYPELQGLLARGVRAFEHLRAALPTRYRAPQAGRVDEEHRPICCVGLPGVMDEFRSTWTLTGPVAAERQLS